VTRGTRDQFHPLPAEVHHVVVFNILAYLHKIMTPKLSHE
jgi:hypothetical protein